MQDWQRTPGPTPVQYGPTAAFQELAAPSVAPPPQPMVPLSEPSYRLNTWPSVQRPYTPPPVPFNVNWSPDANNSFLQHDQQGNLVQTGGTPLDQLAQDPTVQAGMSLMGATPGAQRGGYVHGPGGVPIATTPMTATNFATYGREGLLSLLTYALGMDYQQPLDGSQPTSKDPVTWAMNQFGNAINAPLDAFNSWRRNSDAFNRGKSVRNLLATGSASGHGLISPLGGGAGGGGFIDIVTSAIFGGTEKFTMAGIQKAIDRGNQPDMIRALSTYYDLSPDVVAAIAANPALTDEQLGQLTDGQALSLNPIVNMAGELAGTVAAITIASRLGGGLAGGLGTGLGLEGSAAARVAGLAAKAYAVNSVAGWTVRGLEWGIKEVAGIAGWQGVTQAMDRLLWQMPLSMNPGLNLLDAFTTHAPTIRGPQGIAHGNIQVGHPGTLSDVGLVRLSDLSLRDSRKGTVVEVAGRPVILRPHDDPALQQSWEHFLSPETNLDTLAPMLKRVGWERPMLERAFGEGGMHSLDDLKNALHYVAMQVVRDEQGPNARLAFAELPTIEGRSLAFTLKNHRAAVEVLRDNIEGRSATIPRAFKEQFWELQKLNDTRTGKVKRMLTDTFDPVMGLANFAAWIGTSKITHDAIRSGLLREGTVPVLRSDVNLAAVRAFRDNILAKYGPTDVVSRTDLNWLKNNGGAVESYGTGHRLVRTGSFKDLTRTQVENILQSVESDFRERVGESKRDPQALYSQSVLGPGVDVMQDARVTGLTPTDVQLIEQMGAHAPADRTANIPASLLDRFVAETKLDRTELARDVPGTWARIIDWYDHKINDVVMASEAYRGLRDSGFAFNQQAAEGRLPTGLANEANEGLDRALYELANPLDPAKIDTFPQPAVKRWQDAIAFATDLASRLQSHFESPLSKVRVADLEGHEWAIPRGYNVSDLEALAQQIADAKPVNAADAALLADPLIHPFAKMDALRRSDPTIPEAPDAIASMLAETGEKSIEDLTASAISYGEKAANLAGESAQAGQMFQAVWGHWSEGLETFMDRAQAWNDLNTGKDWTEMGVDPLSGERKVGLADRTQRTLVRRTIEGHRNTLASLDEQLARTPDAVTYTTSTGQEVAAAAHPVVGTPTTTIAARTTGPVHVLDFGKGMDTLLDLSPEAGSIRTDPHTGRMLSLLRDTDPAQLSDQLVTLLQDWQQASTRAKRQMHTEMLDAANRGEANAAELFLLRATSTAWRVADGQLWTGRQTPQRLDADLISKTFDHAASVMRDGRIEVLGPEDAAPMEGTTVTSGSARDLAAWQAMNPGFTPDLGPDRLGVVDAMDTGHTLVDPSDPIAAEIAARHAGVSRETAVIETQPSGREALQSQRDVAAQNLSAAEARLEALNHPVGWSAPDWGLSPEMSSLYEQYVGAPSPANLGEAADAVQSIDFGLTRGAGGEMAPADLGELHSALLALIHERLSQEGSQPVATNITRSARRAATDVKLYASELRDVARSIQDRVVHADDPLAGWEDTRYEFGQLPTYGIDGGPLAPRLMWRNVTEEWQHLNDVVPGLGDEVMTGRYRSWPDRVRDSRMTEMLFGAPHLGNAFRSLASGAEHLIGGRNESTIAGMAKETFYTDVLGDHADARNIAIVRGLIDFWRDKMTDARVGLGPLAIGYYRRIGLVDENMLAKWTAEFIKSEYGDSIPEWYRPFAAKPQSVAQAWYKADNRVRQFLLNGGERLDASRIGGRVAGHAGESPFVRFIDAAYGNRGSRIAARTQQGVTVFYHALRFAYDLRIIGMEMIDNPFLVFAREGLSGLREFARKDQKRPLFMGMDPAQQIQSAWYNWMGQTADGALLRFRQRGIMAAISKGQERLFTAELKRFAREHPDINAAMKAAGDTPESYLTRLSADQEMMANRAKWVGPDRAKELYQPYLDRGVITPEEYDTAWRSGIYVADPAIDAEIAHASQPVERLLLERLDAINGQLWQDTTNLFFGQPDRSNVQRMLNHPLLFWPISYQIKATKWLARVLTDRAFGYDTGFGGLYAYGQVNEAHKKLMATDPEYAQFIRDNAELAFVAGMFLPITMGDMGVSMSPWTRMLLDPSYNRNIFSVGPFYTFERLLPRLIREQSQPGSLTQQIAPGGIAEGVRNLQHSWPYMIPIEPTTTQQYQPTTNANPVAEPPQPLPANRFDQQ